MKIADQVYQNVIGMMNLSRLAQDAMETVRLLKEYEATYGPISKKGKKPKGAIDFKEFVDKHKKRK